MKAKYIALKPIKVNAADLAQLEDEFDVNDWHQKSRDLQVRRWRKLNRRMRQGDRL